jgi:putative hydrolase of the HAD superfamily
LSRLKESFGPEISWGQDEFFTRWEAIAEKYLPFSPAGKQLSFLEQRRMRIKEVFQADLSADESDRRFQIYLEGYNSHWKAYPDVMPCLQALQAHRLGLITNGEGPQQRAKLATLGISERFSPIIVSLEVGLAKPDREIFELAATLAGVATNTCIYVGDRLDTDAQAAAGAGMRGVWLNRVDDTTGQGVPTIPSLLALPPLVLAMSEASQ